jgi:hypothetical protein
MCTGASREQANDHGRLGCRLDCCCPVVMQSAQRPDRHAYRVCGVSMPCVADANRFVLEGRGFYPIPAYLIKVPVYGCRSSRP